MKRNWKRLSPHNLRDSFRLTKDHGIAEKRLSVERQAELLGKSPDWLYKCLADASMPANLIPAFEAITGANFVSLPLDIRWRAGHRSAHRAHVRCLRYATAPGNTQ